MVKELVFHLGDSKTGSTSIQRTLAAGAWAGGPSLFYNTKGNHIPLAHTLNRPDEKRFLDRRWSVLADDLGRSDAEIGVISAEVFEFTDPDAFAETVRSYLSDWEGRIRLISYIRPHAERLVSTYSERSKQGLFLGSMDEMHERLIETGLLTYAPRLTRWRALFGAAHELRPLVRSLLTGQDVVLDFLDFVARGAPVRLTERIVANEALSVADLAALRTVHRTIGQHGAKKKVDAHKALGWNLAELIAEQPRDPAFEKPMIHRALAEKVRDTYREDAARMDELFFRGTPLGDALQAAPDRALPAAQPIRAEEIFAPRDLRIFTGMGLLLGRLMQADPKSFRKDLRPTELRAAGQRRKKARAGSGSGSGRHVDPSKAAKLVQYVRFKLRRSVRSLVRLVR